MRKIVGKNDSGHKINDGRPKEKVNDFLTRIDNQVDEIEKIPLPSNLVSTFKDSNYRTVITKEPVIVYRAKCRCRWYIYYNISCSK